MRISRLAMVRSSFTAFRSRPIHRLQYKKADRELLRTENRWLNDRKGRDDLLSGWTSAGSCRHCSPNRN